MNRTMSERDPDKLADELEQEASRMQEQSEHLRGEIHEAREDWERKRADAGVPGAPPPDPEDESERAEESDEEDRSAAAESPPENDS